MSKKNDAMIDLAYCDGFRAGHNNAMLSMTESLYYSKIPKIDKAEAFAVEKAIAYRKDEALKIIKLEKKLAKYKQFKQQFFMPEVEND